MRAPPRATEPCRALELHARKHHGDLEECAEEVGWEVPRANAAVHVLTLQESGRFSVIVLGGGCAVAGV